MFAHMSCSSVWPCVGDLVQWSHAPCALRALVSGQVPSYALPKKKHGRRDLGEFAVWYANRPPPESIDMLHSYDFVAHHLVASRL